MAKPTVNHDVEEEEQNLGVKPHVGSPPSLRPAGTRPRKLETFPRRVRPHILSPACYGRQVTDVRGLMTRQPRLPGFRRTRVCGRSASRPGANDAAAALRLCLTILK